MKHLFFSVSIFLSIYSIVNCDVSTFIPLCPNSVFKYEGKEVNGFFNMSMGIRWIDDLMNNYKSNIGYHINIVRPSRMISEDNIKDDIKKLVQKRPLLDKGYLIKELVGENFLRSSLNLIALKPEESLVLGKNSQDNLNQYYDKQLLELKTFEYILDFVTKKKKGLSSDFK